MKSCPLCARGPTKGSWLGQVHYRDRAFPFSECVACGSLFCDPMPTVDVLSAMYGADYARGFVHEFDAGPSKDPGRTLRWLAQRAGGTFVDYGCGDGALLAAARAQGWQVLGVEYDREVVAEVSRRHAVEVIDAAGVDNTPHGRADVLHLGDVVEHLTDVDTQLRAILRLLKPGGLLIAQGPLEANFCLFAVAIKLGRRLRPRRLDMAPYHVLLATARGQRALFRRLGLVEVEFVVSEVAWPAPGAWDARLLSRPRELALYSLRQASRGLSRLRPRDWGNRYFYVGRVPSAGMVQA